MPLVKTLVPGEEPAATETAVWLHNNTGGTLTIGILQGEYLKFPPGVTSGYALTTNNQYPRYQRQIMIQPTYAQWFSLGYLTTPPPPPEPEEPEPEESEPEPEPEPELPDVDLEEPEPQPPPKPAEPSEPEDVEVEIVDPPSELEQTPTPPTPQPPTPPPSPSRQDDECR